MADGNYHIGVSKNGDTILGSITAKNCGYRISLPIKDTDTSFTSRLEQNYSFRDQNGAYIGGFGILATTTGMLNTYYNTIRKVNNVSKINELQLQLESDGTPKVYITSPDAWRTALNIINKNGDTIPGTLKIEGTASLDTNNIYRNASLNLSLPTITPGEIPTYRSEKGLFFRGRDAAQAGLVACTQATTDGSISLYISANNKNINNNNSLVSSAIQLFAYRNGDVKVSTNNLSVYSLASSDSINIKLNYMSVTTNPSSTIERGFNILDKNSKAITFINGKQSNDGTVETVIAARNYPTNSIETAYSHYLQLSISRNNVKKVNLDKEAWLEALLKTNGLSNNTDLNTLKNGIYRLSSGSTYPNAPTTGLYGVLIIIKGDLDNYYYQFLYTLHNTIYVRMQAGAEFGNWYKFIGTQA